MPQNSVTVNIILSVAFILTATLFISPADARSFESSFESLADFQGFYIVPPGDYDSYHELTTENVHTGHYSHKAWILKARDTTNDGQVYLPHRAYPTIRLQKTQGGVFKTPCFITLWVNLDILLADRGPGKTSDWFSFMTFTPDTSSAWANVVTVNIAPDGYVRLMHVPRVGEKTTLFQASPSNDPSGILRFPMKTWVRLDVYLDLDSANGLAKVWQNGKLVSSGNVRDRLGTLAQAHFGLYASAMPAAGVIYNDDLRIIEISGEAAADSILAKTATVIQKRHPSAPAALMSISPNPSAKQLSIMVNLQDLKHDSKVIFRVYDLTGQLIRTLPVSGQVSRNQFVLDASGLNCGVYIIRCRIGDQDLRQRFVMTR